MTDPTRINQLPPPPPPPPPPEQVWKPQHTVAEGETLTGIAADHHTTVAAILAANPQVRDPDIISTGEVLNMPDVTVAPPVVASVDAVLGPDATPEQRNEAYARMQDYVDEVGGVGDQGIAAAGLPAQSQTMLADAGLPTIPPEVVSAVDLVIGGDATFEQRVEAYGAVNDYVDRVGGIGDAGIVADALPARAGELLHDAGLPVGLQPEVLRSVDGLLAGDATPQQQRAAYVAVQEYVNGVGGIGDAGIVAEALPARAAQLLIDGGNAGLRFEPEVVDAVDQAIAPASTDRDSLAGYEALQAYVDEVGGIGDAGIVADALPERAVTILREAGIALDVDASTAISAEDVRLTALAGDTPQQQVEILDEGLAGLDPATRSELLADPDVQQMIQAAADEATATLQDTDGVAEAVPALRAAENLDALTGSLDPELAGEILNASVDAFAAYRQNDSGGMIGPEGMQTLAETLGRGRGTPAGDAALEAFGELGFYDINAVHNHVAEGGSPAYAMHAGVYEDAIGGVETFSATHIDGAAGDYVAQMEELNYLIASSSDTMTPEQLDAAISEYVEGKGPEWEAQLETLQQQLAQDGATLLDQIDALNAGIPGMPTDQQAAFRERAAALLADPNAQLAVTTALRQNPELVRGEDGEQLLQTLADLGVTGDDQVVATTAAAAYLGENVLGSAEALDLSDPASLAAARGDINAALRDNPALADVMQVTPEQLDDLADALLEVVPTATQSVDDPLGHTLTVARNLNNTFDKIDGILGRDTPYSVGFRSAALTMSTSTLLNSIGNFMDDPSLANAMVGMVDTARVGVHGQELVAAIRNTPEGSYLSGLKAASKVVHLLGAGFAGVDGLARLAEGDLPGASFNAAIAGGTAYAVLGSGAWAGPIGFGIATVGALGLFIYDGVRASQHNSRFETETTEAFLEHAGFDEDAAAALRDQSGQGHSPLPLLTTYAEHKGYDMSVPGHREAFVEWVNELGTDDLADLRDALHRALDRYEGDPSRLGSDTSRGETELYVNPSTGGAQRIVSQFEVDTVGEIDTFLFQRNADTLEAPPA